MSLSFWSTKDFQQFFLKIEVKINNISLQIYTMQFFSSNCAISFTSSCKHSVLYVYSTSDFLTDVKISFLVEHLLERTLSQTVIDVMMSALQKTFLTSRTSNHELPMSSRGNIKIFYKDQYLRHIRYKL